MIAALTMMLACSDPPPPRFGLDSEDASSRAAAVHYIKPEEFPAHAERLQQMLREEQDPEVLHEVWYRFVDTGDVAWVPVLARFREERGALLANDKQRHWLEVEIWILCTLGCGGQDCTPENMPPTHPPECLVWGGRRPYDARFDKHRAPPTETPPAEKPQ